jgi:hypothetical protein
MSYNRESWEEVSFQYIEEMDGSLRSGYYPTGEGLVTGNIAIDYAFGNFPLQPNEDRIFWGKLGVGDNNKIAAVEWDQYPKNSPEGYTGATLEGGAAFYWPELWFCSGYGQGRDLSTVINEMVSYGVPREYFVDFTFSGGVDEWDSNGEPNYDGAILYSYIPANVILDIDWLGQPVYGSSLDNVVIGANQSGGYEDSVDSGYPEDYMLVVATNDPRKDNAGWWFN